jgi:zinc transport system permease protein
VSDPALLAGLPLPDFLLRAFLAALGVALISAPLGCFVVWRRLSYFGATLAHSALLGIALGLLLGLNPVVGIAASSVVVALIFVLFQRQQVIGSDTTLGILAHSGLALGLVALSFVQGLRVDLMAYLFGDVLAVTTTELAWIYGGGVAVLAVLLAIWRPLLAVTLHEDLARAEGVPVATVHLGFTLSLAVTIALAMKVVGVLLIVSLLIIPAATARRFARTPEGMAGLAAVVGAFSVAGGLAASLAWDTPAGPSIVSVGTLLFALSLLAAAARRGEAS